MNNHVNAYYAHNVLHSLGVNFDVAFALRCLVKLDPWWLKGKSRGFGLSDAL